MEMYKEKIYNVETNETTFRDFTEEEILKLETFKKEIAEKDKEAEARIAARKAVLDKLGLTAEDLEALGL